MTNWTLTLGLQNLRSQVNAAFPDRDKASDGSIGDAAHQAESSSGHNPDDTAGSRPEWNGDSDGLPEVRAWDMDSDLRAAPATAQQVVDHIRGLSGVGTVLRYMIYNHKIYKASNGWKAETYTGASGHEEHIHFSGQWSDAADRNTSFNYRLEEIPVALTAADKNWLTQMVDARADDIEKNVLSALSNVPAAVWSYSLADPYDNDGSRRQLAAGTWLQYVPSRGQVEAARIEVLAALAPKDEDPAPQ